PFELQIDFQNQTAGFWIAVKTYQIDLVELSGKKSIFFQQLDICGRATTRLVWLAPHGAADIEVRGSQLESIQGEVFGKRFTQLQKELRDEWTRCYDISDRVHLNRLNLKLLVELHR